MDEELQGKFLEYLGNFEAGIEKAAEFSEEQAPLVVQEYIQWQIVFGLSLFVVGLLAMIILLGCWVRWFKEYKSDSDEFFASVLITALVVLFSSIMVYSGSKQAAKAYIAPRVVILEKLSEIIR